MRLVDGESGDGCRNLGIETIGEDAQARVHPIDVRDVQPQPPSTDRLEQLRPTRVRVPHTIVVFGPLRIAPHRQREQPLRGVVVENPGNGGVREQGCGVGVCAQAMFGHDETTVEIGPGVGGQNDESPGALGVHPILRSHTNRQPGETGPGQGQCSPNP